MKNKLSLSVHASLCDAWSGRPRHAPACRNSRLTINGLMNAQSRKHSLLQMHDVAVLNLDYHQFIIIISIISSSSSVSVSSMQ